MKNITALVAFVFFWVANFAVAALPTPLTGTWESSDESERGTIVITVTKETGVHVEGIVHLTGSEDCTEPIFLRGTITSGKIRASTDDKEVCKYNGTLFVEATGVVSEKGHAREHYVGVFSYRLFGIVWKQGTFRVNIPNGPKK